MRFIDLFCGIGGFRIGFERNGFECVFSSDFDKNVQDIYELNFSERPYGDITKVNPKEIPDFDVLTGGFPCQPFSISGRKLGFEDTRGTLFFDICRIIDEKKPSVVVLENVKHLIYHDKRRTFTTILKTLRNLDYNVNFKVLNLKDFGLPQNRERIVIIGTKKGIFNFDLMRITKSQPLSHFLDVEGDFEYLDESTYTMLTPNLWRKQRDSGLLFVGYMNKVGFKNGIRPNSHHLSRVHKQMNRIYSVNGYHPTIPSQESSGRFYIYLPNEKRVRKLTINECYRIMGFPDDFKKHGTLGVQIKQIGNSIGINMVEEISRQILNQSLLNDESQRETTGNLQQLLFR